MPRCGATTDENVGAVRASTDARAAVEDGSLGSRR